MIHQDRIKLLNERPPASGKYVLYWMQQSQRAEDNHALEYAIERANGLNLPVVVFFGLTASYPEAQERHYAFMLEGLRETKEALRERGIAMAVRGSDPAEGAIGMAEDAAVLVADRGYLRVQREWRERVASSVSCPVIQVESDLVVPLEAASNKEEYGAGTLRPKIERVLDRYLHPVEKVRPGIASLPMWVDSLDLNDIDGILAEMDTGRTAKRVRLITGGAAEAKRRLEEFISERLDVYETDRNDPGRGSGSNLSPYLHFGQISPVTIALAVIQSGSPGTAAFLEQLIVRRELAMNFVFYNRNYDSFSCLPEWARKTLGAHRKDARQYRYRYEELEAAQTHDPYWNAAQTELVRTGTMHGYMRMYWGKKILEWGQSPEEAYETALRLNNTWQLDGRDANGYAGIAWCFGKHDRAWPERPVFGKVRSMTAGGLERKFDIQAYVRRIAGMKGE